MRRQLVELRGCTVYCTVYAPVPVTADYCRTSDSTVQRFPPVSDPVLVDDGCKRCIKRDNSEI